MWLTADGVAGGEVGIPPLAMMCPLGWLLMAVVTVGYTEPFSTVTGTSGVTSYLRVANLDMSLELSLGPGRWAASLVAEEGKEEILL